MAYAIASAYHKRHSEFYTSEWGVRLKNVRVFQCLSSIGRGDNEMKKVFFIAIISLTLVSKALYADYSSIVQITLSGNKFKRSICLATGDKVAKSMGMFVNATAIVSGNTMYIQDLSSLKNKMKRKGSSFLQVHCHENDMRTREVNYVYVVVNNNNKTIRQNVATQYSKRFVNLISKEYPSISGHTIIGPSTL